MSNLRIGFGFDVHPLVKSRPFFLGGISIDHYKGAVGHSDADVLIHAICDAILGAANLGDIGIQFPNTDNTYKNIDSKVLLQKSVELISNKNYVINNVDCTVCLELPKIKPHISDMQNILAPIMKISPDDVSIKATTSEKLGFVGSEEGITAYAVVLLIKK